MSIALVLLQSSLSGAYAQAASPQASAPPPPSAVVKLAPVVAAAPIGATDAPVQKVDQGMLAAAGLDSQKLDAAAVRLAGHTASTGAGLYLIRQSPGLADVAENLLPKGLPVQKAVAYLREHPKATAVVVGVTVAGYTLTAIHEYTTEESIWRRYRYLFMLLTGTLAGFIAWFWHARLRSD